MAIKHIIIKNYKSLENLDLPLNPLTVFVGPNNAGKSNIFNCFRFLSSFVKTGADAVQERGGFEQIVFNGDITRKISIGLHGSIRVADKERLYRYFIEFEAERWGVRCYNKKEVFSLITEKGEQKLLEYPSEKDMAIAWDETGKKTGGKRSFEDIRAWRNVVFRRSWRRSIKISLFVEGPSDEVTLRVLVRRILGRQIDIISRVDISPSKAFGMQTKGSYEEGL